MGRPNLFIIGAPKSGTTSMYEYLSGHPDIYMSPYKEPMFFCPDVRGYLGQARLAYGRDDAEYLTYFDEASDEKWLGEATTRYLASHLAAGLVHEFNPEARAVAMLRNPVELVHALHNERVSQGNEPITNFVDAINADERRSRGEDLPGQMNSLGTVYREAARYAVPLQRWFDALGRERVHVIVFDDFTHDPGAELHRLLEFLGVDASYQPPTFAVHNTNHRQRRAVRSVMESRVGTFLSDDLARAVLGSNGRARLAYRFRKSRVNRRYVPRQPMPDDLRRELEVEFRPDVDAVSQMLGRDLAGQWFAPLTAATLSASEPARL